MLLYEETNLNYDSTYSVKNDCMLTINIHSNGDQYGHSIVLLNGGKILKVIDDGSVGGFRNTLSACIPVNKDSIISFDKGDPRNSATIELWETEYR